MNKIIPSLSLLIALNTVHYCWAAQIVLPTAIAPLLQENDWESDHQEQQSETLRSFSEVGANSCSRGMLSFIKYYRHLKDMGRTTVACGVSCMTSIGSTWMPGAFGAQVLDGVGGIVALITPSYLLVQDIMTRNDFGELTEVLEGVPN